MILRLAYKNMKKSMSDEVVYFVTLVLGICMYYMFCAVTEQPAMQEVLNEGIPSKLVRCLWYFLPAVRMIVLTVFAGVIAYTNHFLMRRRKKEFGIYLLLGMKKRAIAGILFAETMIVGICSLLAGVVSGILLSQGMSVLVSGILERDFREFAFVVSGKAVADTLFCFVAVYAAVYVLNLITVWRLRLIRLLHAGEQSEKSRGKPLLCVVVFVIAAVLLGWVYDTVTVRLDEIVTPGRAFLPLGVLFAATVMIFWSLSGLFLFLARFRKRFYLRGIHAFTVSEISSRVNTNVLAGSMICFLMFIGMSMVNSCFSLCHTLNSNVKTLVPVDVCIAMSCAEGPDYRELPFDTETIKLSEVFAHQGIDTAMFRDSAEFTVYRYCEWDETEKTSTSDNTMFFIGEEVMKLSDYNKLAKLYGYKQHTLAQNEYFVVSNRKWHRQWSEKYYLSKNHVITLGGVDYVPKYSECQDGFFRLDYIPNNFGFTVVPDTAADANLHPGDVYFAAHYNAATEEDEERIDAYLKSDEFFRAVSSGGFIGKRDFWAEYKSDMQKKSIAVITMTLYLGLYIGILFVMVSAALFSLKELTQAVDSRHKYRTLYHLGVERRMLRQSMFFQNAVFFGIPLIFAVLHTVFGSRALSKLISEFIEIEIGEFSASRSIWGTMIVLIGIYLLYFVFTCRGSRRIISGRKDD